MITIKLTDYLSKGKYQWLTVELESLEGGMQYLEMVTISSEFCHDVRTRLKQVQESSHLPRTMIAYEMGISTTTLAKVAKGKVSEVSEPIYKVLSAWLAEESDGL